MSTLSRHVTAPRGAAITCKGWPREATPRMQRNNLDPEGHADAGYSDAITTARESGIDMPMLTGPAR